MKNSKFAKLKLDSFEVLTKQAQRNLLGGNPYGGGSGGGTTQQPPLNCSTTTTPSGDTPWRLGYSGTSYWTEDYCCTVVYGRDYASCRSVCQC